MTPTPESQQAALKPCPFCGGANVKTHGPYGWYNRWCIIHYCKTFPENTSGVFEGFSSEASAVAAWNTRATQVSESHAALAEEIADAIYSGGDYGTSGQKAWRLRKTAVEMADCLRIAQRAMQAALRAHPAGGVSEDRVQKVALALFRQDFGEIEGWDDAEYQKAYDTCAYAPYSGNGFVNKWTGLARAALRAAGIGAGVDNGIWPVGWNDPHAGKSE